MIPLKDLPLKNKRVLMRVDFNVPLSKEGTIADDTRIQSSLPSIQYLLEQGVSLILMSHLGRPKGEKNPELSLAPCAKRLAEYLKIPVPLAPDCLGEETQHLALNLKTSQVLLLENVRFHLGEEKPEEDPDFVKQLASLGEFYVNDAFGSCHRAHASVAQITKFFPQKAAAGFLLEKELSYLSPFLRTPDRPFYSILGGAKISTKAGVIHNLLKHIDALFLGGGMCFPFLKAQGFQIGDSLCSEEDVQAAYEILQEKPPLYLPSDLIITEEITSQKPSQIVSVQEGVPPHFKGVDLGPKTLQQWEAALQKAATIFWNGPLGVFETQPFDQGTFQIASALAKIEAESIIGGGDSVAAIRKMGLEKNFAHLCTGGGAALEFLEFGHLPGIDALNNF